MGYNSIYRPYNPIASAVDTAASMQEIFNGVEDRKRREEELAFQRGITLREQNRADAQDARAAETHALDLKSKTQTYNETAEQIRKRKENEATWGDIADIMSDPENAAALKILGQNRTLSNNPEKALNQIEAFERLDKQIPQIAPYLADPSKRTVVTDQQLPEFFKDFNIAYGPTINKGTDANGEKGAFKYVNAVTSDNDNNLSFGLLVKPKNGDAYPSGVTADRGGNPDAPVVKTPAQGAALHVRTQAKFGSLVKPLLAKLVRNGDENARAKLESLLNEESMQSAYEAAKAEIAEMQKKDPKLKLTPFQERQILLDKVPDTNTMTTKERGAWAKEKFDENLITVGKGQIVKDSNTNKIVAEGAPDIESVPLTSSGFAVYPDGRKEQITQGRFNPHEGRTAKEPDSGKEGLRFNQLMKPRFDQLSRYLTNEAQIDFADASAKEQESVLLTPKNLTPEGKKLLTKYQRMQARGEELVYSGYKAGDVMQHLLGEDKRGAFDLTAPAPAAIPAAAAPKQQQAEEGGFWSNVVDYWGGKLGKTAPKTAAAAPKPASRPDAAVPAPAPKPTPKGYEGSLVLDGQTREKLTGPGGSTQWSPVFGELGTGKKSTPPPAKEKGGINHGAIKAEITQAVRSGKIKSIDSGDGKVRPKARDIAQYLMAKYPGTYKDLNTTVADMKTLGLLR